jgi:hypothetical protein
VSDYARYRHLAIERAKPPATAKQLDAVERVLGARLPDSFREFLCIAHGAYIEYDVDVALEDGTIESMCYVTRPRKA